MKWQHTASGASLDADCLWLIFRNRSSGERRAMRITAMDERRMETRVNVTSHIRSRLKRNAFDPWPADGSERFYRVAIRIRGRMVPVV